MKCFHAKGPKTLKVFECLYAKGYQPSWGFWGILFMSRDYGKDDIKSRQKKTYISRWFRHGFLGLKMG
jgi:hypothetical protein